MKFLKKKENLPRRRSSGGPRENSSPDSSRRYSFQRNRTMAGSGSSHTPADVGSKPNTGSPRVTLHQLAIKRRKIGGIFLVVFIISILLYWLLMQFSARVTIGVSDTTISKSVDDIMYQEAINNYLGANPFERFRFILDKTRLHDSINKEHPEVGSIDSVDMGSIGEMRVVISMRHPVASWTINNNKYYVDANGFAFSKNYFATNVVAIVDESDIAIEDGAPVVSNRFLSFVGKAVAAVKGYKYTVTQAILPDNTTRQLEIRLKGQEPTIKLSIDRPVGEQIEDMSRALSYINTHNLKVENIDVRVSGKAFYK